jgi:phenylpyruvate tautomerase PptA (4-oxalocrotonate tautomerase family)
VMVEVVIDRFAPANDHCGSGNTGGHAAPLVPPSSINNVAYQQEDQMPTWTCVTAQGTLTLTQKQEIARVCTDVYLDEFGLKRYMTQVIFDEIAEGDRYIANKPARPDLIWLRCDVREGRTEDQKARLLHRVQQGVAKAANVPEEVVWIYLCDLPPWNIMEWGHIMPRLGAVSDDRALPEDDNWFQAMSAPMQASLRALSERTTPLSARTALFAAIAGGPLR